MSVIDDQLELLEAYIDGELPASEEDALRRRLESEPVLSSALDALRQERDVRTAVWKTFEPNPTTVERLIARVDRAVDRHNAWAYRIARYRIPFAAAACILIGFFVGWIGRGGPASIAPNGDPVAEVIHPGNPVPNVPVVPAPPNTGITTVSSPLAS